MKVALVLFFLPTIFAIDYDKVWARYKLRFRKNYTSPAEAAEAKAFVRQCVHENMIVNSAFYQGEIPFTVGLNDFSDGNLTEVRNQLCPPIHPPVTRISLPILNITIGDPVPDDLSYFSFLQPIVNQGPCGSCWAFATVAQLESMYLLNLISFSFKFSTQYLMDCDRASPNNGCYGGWPSVAMGNS